MSTLPKNPKSDIRAHKSGCSTVFLGGGARMDKEVLIPFGPADFQRVEKPKGVPLEIDFFVEGGLRKGLEGGQEPSKTLLHIFKQQKNKILKSADQKG